MKLDHISKIEGIISCIGNLHIGGAAKDTIEIGGLDNPVIKHPITNEPYIPGSSLKGKMRCSVERAKGLENICICGDPSCPICVVFGSRNNGTANDKDNHRFPPLGPTRLIVRDAPLTKESRIKFKETIEQADKDYMGIKYENVISRTTGRAEHPRPIEFVPAGTEFELNMSLLVYKLEEDDNAAIEDYKELVRKALRAVEDTYLGGMGSRGYGQVEFRKLNFDGDVFKLR